MFRCYEEEWTKKYFVLRGHFIFIIEYNDRENSIINEIPVDLTFYNFKATEDIYSSLGVPYDYAIGKTTICLSSIKCDLIFRCKNQDERDRWIIEIARMKDKAIKVRLGHQTYSVDEKEANSYGKSLKVSSSRVMRENHQKSLLSKISVF